MRRPEFLGLALAFLVTFCGAPASAGCGATTFQPISPFVPRGTTHNAYFLTDPAGQQTAVFDIQWGGALASLKLNGVEMVWGNATGGMVQPALHTFPTSQDYNPTQAGDNISSSESFPWGFELAGYVPYSFTNFVRYPASCTATTPCSPGSTPQLVGGLYPNSGLTGGTAFYVSPQTYWAGTTSTYADFGTDTINQNQSTHLFDAFWGLGPSSSRTFVWYVMAGTWSQALAFAQTH